MPAAIKVQELRDRGFDVKSRQEFEDLMTPEKVAGIFRIKAEGAKLFDLPEIIGKKQGWTGSVNTLSDLLHCRFATPLYDKVSPEHAAAVQATQFKKRRSPAGPKPGRLELLQSCLEPYRQWREARQAVLDAGVSEENLQAWLDITLEDVR